MRYGSICSGVEAASLAWEPLGWTPAWFAEVDPFCSKLLARRWPQVPNLGDITSADFAERAAALGPVNLLVGGTPCQSFSHAGKRGGLADPRGNLTLRYLDLVAAIRPAWVVWENVPGVLSDDGGRTFGTVLGRLADLGYRLAYRVLDAAFAGVPQRRRRVFVVGHSGTRCPGEVLALAEGQGRDSQAGGAAGAEAAADAGGRPAAVSVVAFDSKKDGGDVSDLSPTLRAMNYSGSRANGGGQVGVGYPASPQAVTTLGTVTHALTCEGGDASEDGTGRGTPVVAYPIDMRQASRGERLTNNRREGSSGGAPGTGVGEAGDPAPTLANSHTPVVAVCLGSDPITTTDIAQPLTTRHGDPGVVAYQCHGTNVGPMGTLKAASGGVPFVVQETPPGVRYVVRRLTPRECERLQGFPDDHTLIPVKPAGKTRRKDREYAEIDGVTWEMAADGPRYRAIGNSMAVPVMRQIGARIDDLAREG